jgi:hypothetical protein
MADIYISRSRIERRKGPIRDAFIAGESKPVVFSVHGGIAKHYGVNAEDLGETHAATIDYLIAAVGG